MLSNAEDFLLDESSVLAFLADCEEMNESITPCAVSAVSTPTQCAALPIPWSDSPNSVASPPKQPEKKSWRQRRKEEVLHLREVTKQLSNELERLKVTAGVRSTLPNATAPMFPLKTHKTEASLMWERIAGRQSTPRLQCEAENAKLRQAVTRHLQQAKSLQRAIKRKLREDLASSSMDLIRHNRLNTRGVTPPLDNNVVFEKLLVGLDDVYESVDSFFEYVGMNRLACPGRRNNSMSSRMTRGVFVEFLDNYAVPFDILETAKAIWTPEKDPSDKTNVYFFQNFKTDSETQMWSMGFALRLEGVDFRVVMRSVTRKYIENGKTIFISRTLIQPIYENMSLAFTETRRMALKHGDLSAVGPTTVIQTHREATLQGDLTGIDFTKYPSLDTGLENWEKSITNYNNRLEDQLIRTVT